MTQEEYDALTESEIEELYDQFLDDLSPSIHIAGCDYDPSTVLKAVDPIAYDVAVSDFHGTVLLEEVDE